MATTDRGFPTFEIDDHHAIMREQVIEGHREYGKVRSDPERALRQAQHPYGEGEPLARHPMLKHMAGIENPNMISLPNANELLQTQPELKQRLENALRNTNAKRFNPQPMIGS